MASERVENLRRRVSRWLWWNTCWCIVTVGAAANAFSHGLWLFALWHLCLAVSFLHLLEKIPDPSWINDFGKVEGPW
jgi:hypothetical protein